MKKFDVISAKILTGTQLLKQVERWRFKGKKIVFTNGCFDLLHYGHVNYLAHAADFGNILIVGLNSDASVKLLNKGHSRPLQDEKSRATIIASLHVVSAVVLFEEETPYDLIQLIKPDVLVKGSDYKVEQIAGHDLVQSYGGKVELVDLVTGFSTSLIEKKIKEG